MVTGEEVKNPIRSVECLKKGVTNYQVQILDSFLPFAYELHATYP